MSKKTLGKIQTEEQAEIKKFILVLGGLIIIIIGIYFFTRAFVTKDLFKEKDSNGIQYQEGKINDTDIIVGNMLNRPYDEYYVIAFGSKSNLVNYYDVIVSKYTSGKDATKMYYIDMDDELNKKYKANEQVTTTFDTLENLKLGELTLLKIKNKKVAKILTNDEDIKKELNIKASE